MTLLGIILPRNFVVTVNTWFISSQHMLLASKLRMLELVQCPTQTSKNSNSKSIALEVVWMELRLELTYFTLHVSVNNTTTITSGNTLCI